MRRHAPVALCDRGCRSQRSRRAAARRAQRRYEPPTPQPPEHVALGLAAQHVVVAAHVRRRVAPELSWARLDRAADRRPRTLDADIVAAFDERGLRQGVDASRPRSSRLRRNPTYATDPYALAEEPLRSPSLVVEQRLPEPLASQLRTLIALHDDVRLVLAPVELRFEPAGTGGRGVLRLVLIDPRLSNVRWIGEVTSDAAERRSAPVDHARSRRGSRTRRAPMTRDRARQSTRRRDPSTLRRQDDIALARSSTDMSTKSH